MEEGSIRHLCQSVLTTSHLEYFILPSSTPVDCIQQVNKVGSFPSRSARILSTSNNSQERRGTIVGKVNERFPDI